jgi:hypothetical protein
MSAETNEALNTGSSSTMGKLKQAANPSNITFWVASILFVAFFITAFVKISAFAGDKEDWNALKPKITEILVYVLIGIFAFAVAALMYFVQDPRKAIYFSIIVSCVALGLAFSALAVACITR